MIDPEAPVSNPDEFVGHAGLVRRIFSRIGAERPQSVALIGGKKSGKTSLLAYISNEGVRRRFLEGAERFLFVRMCADCEESRNPDSFLKAFEDLLPRVDGGGGSNRYDGVRHVIDGLHTAGKRLVVLLDDFHLITGNERFPLEFFSFLRSMANNYNLAYVTTSFLELQKLCAVKDVQESPFFNIFTNLPIGMLTPEEAEIFFQKISGLDKELAGRVAAWCGNSPYLLKKAGIRLQREKAPDTLAQADFERVLLPDVSPYFEEIVSLLPSSAYKPLQSIAKGKSPEHSEVHLVSSLVKQGFLLEGEGGIAGFSPAFLAFLRKGFTSRMLKGSG